MQVVSAAIPAAAAVAQPDLFAARELQAISFVFHIVLVCFGVAFPAMVLLMEGLWLKTGDKVYRDIAQRWAKAMLVLFAVGVVSGTILSFELGMLWPGWMSRFGGVFGVAFAYEGFSFFVEAIFIAIYVYGWNRLGRRTHFLSGIPIAIAGFTGSMFVIGVNSWMNAPTGFHLVNGKVVDVDPLGAIFNRALPYELLHMYLAAYMVAGFVIAAVYARAWLKGRRDRYNRIALIVPLTIACLTAPVQVLVGDWAARNVARDQPVKLAAMEGLGRTQAGAPLHLGGVYRDGKVVGGLEVPKGLSLLSEHDPNATVTGLESVPPDQRPPVNVVRLSFQAMVGIGTLLVLLAVAYLVTWWRRRRLPRSRWFFRAVVAAGPLSVIALWTGWIVTEVGRQPWIVYRVMRTSEAVTAAGGVWIAFVVLVVVYVGLAVATALVLPRLARDRPRRSRLESVP